MTSRGVEVRRLLADILAVVPAMERDGGRSAILEMFRENGFELPALPAESAPIICYRVIEFAARQPGALQQLAESVRWADRSPLAEKFVREVRRYLPGDFFALDDRLDFIEEIRSLTRPDQLHMYYERIVGDICPVELTDADNLVGELEELNLDEPCHPLIMLTEEIALRTKRLRGRKDAKRWSDRLAGFIDASRSDQTNEERAKLAELRKSQKKRGRADPGSEHASLVLMLDPYVPRPSDGYLLSMWLYRVETSPVQLYARDTPASLDAIRIEVIRQLNIVIPKLSPPGTVADIELEFFLPRDLLDYAVEDWIVSEGHVTLGTQFVVVVRDRDRLYNPLLWPPWQQKWRQVASSKAHPSGPFSRWITCTDAPCRSGELYAALLSDQLVSLGLTFPPPPGVHRLELAEALNAGTPIAVWPRRRCAHPVPASAADACEGVSFRESLCQELAGRCLADLPKFVLEMRRARAAAGNFGSGFALLWDDPDRRPVPDDSHFDAPQYWPQL